jgi:hypothetical protein
MRRHPAAADRRTKTFGECADELIKSMAPAWRNPTHHAAWGMTLQVPQSQVREGRWCAFRAMAPPRGDSSPRPSRSHRRRDGPGVIAALDSQLRAL